MTPEYLRTRLRYDPEAGHLYWLPRGVGHFDTRYAGKQAFTARHVEGYFHGCLDGKSLLAHRVAWAIHHGSWPVVEIDHINGDRADNRIANLRQATSSQNKMNRPAAGVSRNRATGGKWVAYVHKGGRMRYLGRYECFGAAVRARREAAGLLYGEFARRVA